MSSTKIGIDQASVTVPDKQTVELMQGIHTDFVIMDEGGLMIISCAKHSELKKEFHHEGIQELLETTLTKKEKKVLEAEQKKKITHAEHEFRQEKEITLEKHFQNNIDFASRNSAIIRALEDGYGQAEIGRYLDLSAASISYVFRNSNEKSD